ncbi:MAG: response regulator transcription factor [Acidimicrobiales bacterium]
MGDVTIRVFLLDDHDVVRRGLRDLLEAEDDIEVVGEADRAEQAVRRIAALRPDVAVLDVRLPDGDGVEVCREVRSHNPDVVCLMLTSFSDDEALFDAVMAGAAGYLLKQVRENDLVAAIRTVAAGGSLLEPAAIQNILNRVRSGNEDDQRLGVLTAQERKIFDLIGKGMTNRQIGDEIFLAEKTVKNYVSSVLMKLGMERRTEAAAYAARVDERSKRPR